MKKSCLLVLKTLLAAGLALGTAASAALADDQAVQTGMGLEVLGAVVDVLSLLPENCAQEPKACSDAEIQKLIKKSLSQPPFTDRPLASVDPELVEMVKYLVHKANPEQIRKLRAASASYRQTLRDFKLDVFGSQEAEIKALLQATQSRVKTLSLKANMYMLQTIVQTYAVDWGGIYAPDLLTLMREANKPGSEYWKDFTNPFTGKAGAGKAGSVTDFRSYQNSGDHTSFAGLVLYEPLTEKGKKEITGYKIYGCDINGELLQDKGTLFYLTNF